MTDTRNGVQKCDNIVTGMWKFGPEVSPMAIGMFAAEWLQKEGANLLQLYSRKCSKDQNALGFMYKFEEDNHKAFFHRMTDQLKRRFGNGFVGWDVSSPTWIFKDLRKDLRTITVTSRSDDFHACLEDYTGVWGCGKTTDEAIGNLVRSLPDTFGIALKL